MPRCQTAGQSAEGVKEEARDAVSMTEAGSSSSSSSHASTTAAAVTPAVVAAHVAFVSATEEALSFVPPADPDRDALVAAMLQLPSSDSSDRDVARPSGLLTALLIDPVAVVTFCTQDALTRYFKALLGGQDASIGWTAEHVTSLRAYLAPAPAARALMLQEALTARLVGLLLVLPQGDAAVYRSSWQALQAFLPSRTDSTDFTMALQPLGAGSASSFGAALPTVAVCASPLLPWLHRLSDLVAALFPATTGDAPMDDLTVHSASASSVSASPSPSAAASPTPSSPATAAAAAPYSPLAWYIDRQRLLLRCIRTWLDAVGSPGAHPPVHLNQPLLRSVINATLSHWSRPAHRRLALPSPALPDNARLLPRVHDPRTTTPISPSASPTNGGQGHGPSAPWASAAAAAAAAAQPAYGMAGAAALQQAPSLYRRSAAQQQQQQQHPHPQRIPDAATLQRAQQQYAQQQHQHQQQHLQAAGGVPISTAAAATSPSAAQEHLFATMSADQLNNIINNLLPLANQGNIAAIETLIGAVTAVTNSSIHLIFLLLLLLLLLL